MNTGPQNNSSTPTGVGRNLTLEQAMGLATQHHAQGRHADAEQLLRQILQNHPRHAFAMHMLGVIAHQNGYPDDAIRWIEKAIDILPTVALFHANLAEMYRKAAKLDQAVFHGERAVAIDPNSPQAHSNLGIAYFDRQMLDKAEECQRRALELSPNDPRAPNNLGSIMRDRKDRKAAIELYRRVLENHPNHLESINNLGGVLTEEDNPEEAIEVLLRAIRLDQNYAEAHCNLGCAFTVLEDKQRAAVAFNKALSLKPRYVQALEGLGKLRLEEKDLIRAEDLAQSALTLEPERLETINLLGMIHTEKGFPEQAIEYFDKAIALHPESAIPYLGKGQLLLEQGDLDEAEACFRRAMELSPDATLGARLSMARVKKVKEGDENLEALIKEAEELDGMRPSKAIPLHYALGKSFDDIGEYDRAFSHFQAGASLKRAQTTYSAEGNRNVCRRIREFFSPETIERLSGGGHSSNLPIFVLGMPRSGTTLVEQILASHPDVYGAGELPDLLQLANRPRGMDGKNYPESMAYLTGEDTRVLGGRYEEGLRKRAPGAKHITDKMPANFFCTGLIHLILPNARIVHVRRNPVDTCLSGFVHLFNNTQHQSYDLTESGHYYRDYATLMAHWRAVLPQGAFYDVQYEELVADPEEQARQLLDFCRLPWDDACLDFHKTKRQVRTASVTQVRQPIYSSSMERWRKYETHLEPLLTVLREEPSLLPE